AADGVADLEVWSADYAFSHQTVEVALDNFSLVELTPYFTGLPDSPTPSGEVQVAPVAQGTSLTFYQKTTWGGSTYWAFSDRVVYDQASLIAFANPTAAGTLSVVEQTSPTTWVLHLDDAASYLVDNDNNDALIQVRLVPALAPGQGSVRVKVVGG